VKFTLRRVTPAHIYVATQGVVGVLFATAYTTYGVYAVRTAGLGPLELVLVGTALELSVTLAEVPTGVVADVYSRRLSVIIGLSVIGLGFMVMGSVPTFGGLAGGSILMGIGYTFISGAHQAWLADEIDEAPVAPIYLRGTQLGQLGRVAGVPLGVALASLDLRLPMVASGAGYWLLAAILIVVMPERRYTPVAVRHAGAWRAMRITLRDSITTVRERPALVSILAIALLCGMSGEGLGRLAPLHFLDTVGLPERFSEATWFGVLNGGTFLGAALITALAGRMAAGDDARRLMQVLLGLTMLMMGATFVFAVAPGFWPALFGFWIARWVRLAMHPFVIAYVNRGLAPGVRATVLSMVGQADAIGEVCGGPTLGLVASLRSVRTALTVSASLLLGAVVLCVRALPRGRRAAVGS
jgi:DHA3 family tetracycline resistance protein-like MFS transporter